MKNVLGDYMKQMSDREFEIKYNNYYNLLFNVAYSYVRNYEDAMDIIQDTFVKYYRAHKAFGDDNQEKYWLIRVTINTSLDYLKKNKKKIINNEYVNSLPDVSDDSSYDDIINECVHFLKKSYFTVITLFYYDNYSIKEISEILQTSEGNVKVRLNRARNELRMMVEERKNNGTR